MTDQRWDVIQRSNKLKEQGFLETLRAYCITNKLQYSDVHEEVETGIDVWIDTKPYDLKISNSKKLTLFKKLPDGRIYCPLVNHLAIPLLYVMEREKDFICFELRKEDIMFKMFGKGPVNTGKYCGDGNINITFEIQEIMDIAREVLVIPKDPKEVTGDS